MYVYPNGLKCDVSPTRARAFEAIVPPLSVVLIVGGWIPLGSYFFDATRLLWSFNVIAWAIITWTLAIAAVWCGVFKLWCRPISESSLS